MSPPVIAAIVVVAAACYVVIGGLTFALSRRLYPPEDGDDVFQFMAGAFWPFAAPAWLAVTVFRTSVGIGLWLGTKRDPKPTLPKAQARR